MMTIIMPMEMMKMKKIITDIYNNFTTLFYFKKCPLT